MNANPESVNSGFRMGLRAAFRRMNRDHVLLFNCLLPLADFLSVLLAASIATRLYAAWLSAVHFDSHVLNGPYLALLAALLAPILLYDKRFGSIASRGQRAALVRCFVTGFVTFTAAVFLIGIASRVLDTLPRNVVVVWLAISFCLTALTRVLLAANVRRLVRKGVVAEVVAIVGASRQAERLIQHLSQTRSVTVDLLGVFDDVRSPPVPTSGTIDDLIELGKARNIDWIFLTLPSGEQQRMPAIVQRLKTLSVNVALCPGTIGQQNSYHAMDYVGDDMPVALLVDRPHDRWGDMIKVTGQFLPRWILTLVMIPKLIASLLRPQARAVWPARAEPRAATAASFLRRQERTSELLLDLDTYDCNSFLEVARGFGKERYDYVVTPNVDHLIRLHEDERFRELYAAAGYVLLDSRFLAHLLRLTRGVKLPVCTGSDLTSALLSRVAARADRIVIVGGTDEQIRQLQARYDLGNVAHHNPPWRFIDDPQAVEQCLAFVEAHSPFRFCLLAVGSPQQEMLARALQTRGIARGLTFCVGASIDFVTGVEQRAPRFVQRVGCEWLFRLLQSPRRLAARYLVRGPRVFRLLRHTTVVVRERTATELTKAA